jgi:hypothetical protein
MTDNVNIGEQYNIRGKHNVGKIETNYGTADVQASLRELIEAVHVLRGQVSAADRQVIDESLETVSRGKQAEPGKLRRALGNIAGIATVVGQVGAPVVEAVRKVMTALGN